MKGMLLRGHNCECFNALRSVSAEDIRRTIQALVNFKTRNTLSSMGTDLPPGTDISAAAWIERQFQQISAGCGGCLEMKEDMFVEPAQSVGSKPRIVRPTKLVNVYAVLKGTDRAQAKRMYLVITTPGSAT